MINLDDPRVCVLFLPAGLRLASAPETSSIDDAFARVVDELYGLEHADIITDEHELERATQLSIERISRILPRANVEVIAPRTLRYQVDFGPIAPAQIRTVVIRLFVVHDDATPKRAHVDFQDPTSVGLVLVPS